MLYLIAEDEIYYTKEEIGKLMNKYQIEEIILVPDEITIAAELKKGKISTIGFMAPYPPSSVSKKYQENSFLDVVYLPNKFGLLTTGQNKLQIKEAFVLESKMGVKIYEPNLTFADYAGSDVLIEHVYLMEEKEKHGIATKGFMITGTPGTGKSHFAKCAAGHTGRKLVELNLSLFMEMDDGIAALSKFFDFFLYNEGRYIIWIDEIEKMFVGDRAKQMLGILLTRINDMNGSNSKSSFFFIATANNISDLAKTNPEFFRNGRFDVLAFVLNPSEKNAIDIFNLYVKKHIKKFETETFYSIIQNALNGYAARTNTKAEQIAKFILKENTSKMNNLTRDKLLELFMSDKKLISLHKKVITDFKFVFDIKNFMLTATRLYGEQAVMNDRYVHTPAEIEFIVQEAFSSFYFSEKEKTVRALAETYLPLQVSMKDAIQSMLGVAEKFIKI